MDMSLKLGKSENIYIRLFFVIRTAYPWKLGQKLLTTTSVGSHYAIVGAYGLFMHELTFRPLGLVWKTGIFCTLTPEGHNLYIFVMSKG